MPPNRLRRSSATTPSARLLNDRLRRRALLRFEYHVARMNTTPLRLLSSMATRELLATLTGFYTRDSGIAVTAEAAGGVDAARRVQQGEQLDVLVLARDAIDRLVAAGRLRAGSETDLVQSGIAAAVRAGAPQPDFSDEAAVKNAVGTARSLAYSTGPSGVYLEKLFMRWGMLEAIRPRIVVPPPGVPVGTLVARGECELGFQQYSELMNLPGITVLGLLPPAIQQFTTFTGAVATSSTTPDAAARLLQFLASPAHAGARQLHGFDEC
jgi:molybdate transport system substrate-binding protein